MTKVAKAIAVCGVVAGLGIAGLPLGIYASDADLTVSAKIADYVSIEATDNVVTVENQVVNNGAVEEAGTDLNIKTNTDNYYLQISAENSNMVSSDGQDYIQAGTPEQGKSAWGYKVSSDDLTVTGTGEYQGVSTDPTTIATKSGSPTTGGDTVRVDFGVSADGAQAEGTYTGEVTITATPGLQNQ